MGNLAVDFKCPRLLEFNIFEIVSLNFYGQGFEPFHVDKAVALGRDSQIINTERSDIVEEVAPLGWVGMQLVRCRLDDGLGLSDPAPFHWNAEPAISTAPPSWADEEEFFIKSL